MYLVYFVAKMDDSKQQTIHDHAKILLLFSLLAKDRVITNNGKSCLKELALRRDPRLANLLSTFELKESGDSSFIEQLHELILKESESIYSDLFCDTSLEVGKSLSKKEREQKSLSNEKSLIYGEVDYISFYRILRKINANPVCYHFIIYTGRKP